MATHTDLAGMPLDEVRRRIRSLMEEYDRQMTEVGRLCLKAERIREELGPLVSELSAREGPDGAAD